MAEKRDTRDPDDKVHAPSRRSGHRKSTPFSHVLLETPSPTPDMVETISQSLPCIPRCDEIAAADGQWGCGRECVENRRARAQVIRSRITESQLRREIERRRAP